MDEDNSNISQLKRDMAPDGFGDNCPVCGEPFDEGASGVVWPDEENEIDVIAWTKFCSGPLPDHIEEGVEDMGYDAETLAMSYIHKDDNYSKS